MGEKAREILQLLATLPDPVLSKFVDELHGAALALDAMTADTQGQG